MKLTNPDGHAVYYNEVTKHGKSRWQIHNRIVRRWYPKGTDFTQISQAELNDLAEWMNQYPRRILGGRTPKEVYHLAHALPGSSFRE